MANEPEKNIPCKKISHWNEAENDNLFVPNNCSTAESLKLSRVRNTGNGYDPLRRYIDFDILMLVYWCWYIDVDISSLEYRYWCWYIVIGISILIWIYCHQYIDIWNVGSPQRWQRLWSSPHRRRCLSWSTSKPTQPSSLLPEPEVKNI